MKQVKINGIWWDCENTRINGEKFSDFDTANAYAEKIGRRLPTKEELQALIDSGYEWDKKKQGMWFADQKLFLPTKGFKSALSGKIYPGVSYYWSSTAFTAIHAWYLWFYGSGASLDSYYLTGGCSVRCVSDRKDNWWRKLKRWIMFKIYK